MEHFPRYFVWGIQRSPVNSPHKGQWRGTLMFSFIYASVNSWANNRDVGYLRRHRAHYDIIVMMNQMAVFKMAAMQDYRKVQSSNIRNPNSNYN